MHSVMSGKKTVTYDGRTVQHTEEMARAFSHSWRDDDHVLRVDITDLADRAYELTVRCVALRCAALPFPGPDARIRAAKGRAAKGRWDHTYLIHTYIHTYIHTHHQHTKKLDGVPFAALPTKPVTLPPRPGFARGGSRASLSESQRRSPAHGHDDFDPRGTHGHGTTMGTSASGSGKPRAMMRQPSGAGAGARSNAVDLLGGEVDNGGGGLIGASAPAPASSGGFDPFFGAAAAAAAGGFPPRAWRRRTPRSWRTSLGPSPSLPPRPPPPPPSPPPRCCHRRSMASVAAVGEGPSSSRT